MLSLLRDSLHLQQESRRAQAAGGGNQQAAFLEQSQRRIMKLWSLLPVLVFGRQAQGSGTGPAVRLQALLDGTFDQLLARYLNDQRKE